MKPTPEQAQSAFSIIDRAVSRLDCKGLTLVEARDLIAAMQAVSAFVQPDPPKADAPAEPAPKP